jgi:hypothetical protein
MSSVLTDYSVSTAANIVSHMKTCQTNSNANSNINSQSITQSCFGKNIPSSDITAGQSYNQLQMVCIHKVS